MAGVWWVIVAMEGGFMGGCGARAAWWVIIDCCCKPSAMAMRSLAFGGAPLTRELEYMIVKS